MAGSGWVMQWDGQWIADVADGRYTVGGVPKVFDAGELADAWGQLSNGTPGWLSHVKIYDKEVAGVK